jgi:hypothetical protein
MQWVVVIPYQRFGATYLSHLQGPWSWNNHYSMHNNPEERRFHSEAWNHTYVEAPLELLCLLHVNQHFNDFGHVISSSVGDTVHGSVWADISLSILSHQSELFFWDISSTLQGFKSVARVRWVVQPPWAAESQGQQNEYCKLKILIFREKKVKL